MKARAYRPLEKEIQQRFFLALNTLIDTGKICTLKKFIEKYNLHEAKYVTVRMVLADPSKERKYRWIDLDALGYLVRDYGVSAEWLLTGKGTMFAKKKNDVFNLSLSL